MTYISWHSNPSFHLEGGVVLGATAGLIIGAASTREIALVLIGVAVLAFAFYFRVGLWPFISRTRQYERLFGISAPEPLACLKEGLAGGAVAGVATGFLLDKGIASLLLWVGLAALVFRYQDTVRLLIWTVQKKAGGGMHGSAYGRLLTKARGDKELVERLLMYEGKRAPAENREELAEQALARWERDQR